MGLRRHFDLPADDQRFLDEYGLPWETLVDGPQWVLVHDFPTVAGYNHARATAAIRLETGYPNTELNMVYFFPGLARTDGKAIGTIKPGGTVTSLSYNPGNTILSATCANNAIQTWNVVYQPGSQLPPEFGTSVG